MEGLHATPRLGFLELCRGSAAYSFLARKFGFYSRHVDHPGNKFNPKLAIVKLNLTESVSVDFSCELIRSGNIQPVTAAVVRGCASRAREIFKPNGPVLFRSEAFPNGLPTLTYKDLLRVKME